MRRIVLSLAALLALAGPAGAGSSPATPVRTEIRTVHSAVVGRDFRLYIARPAVPAPPGGYPVLYLLDGNITFPLAMKALERRAAEGKPMEPLALVGVGYVTAGDYDPARNVDDTPAVPGQAADDDGSPIGGADLFLQAIQTEMKPLVDAEIPIDRSREALFGHSYGGLFTMHVLFTHPGDFFAYVAASPSLWFGGGILARDEVAFRMGHPELSGLDILLMSAQYEQKLSPDQVGRPDAAERLKRMETRRPVDHVRALAERLDAMPGIHASFVLNERETHSSELPMAVGRAVDFVAAKLQAGPSTITCSEPREHCSTRAETP
ncbi:hypothetical protein SAMN05216548_104234 [Faunimonas pinastri]|uniref:Esterase n=1 Tax=Faunimonas pinastri TaxID=1855383 RepID=A0A1H9FXT8_9HYPH|nr:alpha/beta hydrolase-fold protein [Faunimonas pinastri]SEQ42308.1 hypothetical protein SAMN05216548_104234 [Faunimonas pinastri]